jgi:hypothetical protein
VWKSAIDACCGPGAQTMALQWRAVVAGSRDFSVAILCNCNNIDFAGDLAKTDVDGRASCVTRDRLAQWNPAHWNLSRPTGLGAVKTRRLTSFALASSRSTCPVEVNPTSLPAFDLNHCGPVAPAGI